MKIENAKDKQICLANYGQIDFGDMFEGAACFLDRRVTNKSDQTSRIDDRFDEIDPSGVRTSWPQLHVNCTLPRLGIDRRWRRRTKHHPRLILHSICVADQQLSLVHPGHRCDVMLGRNVGRCDQHDRRLNAWKRTIFVHMNDVQSNLRIRLTDFRILDRSDGRVQMIRVITAIHVERKGRHLRVVERSEHERSAGRRPPDGLFRVQNLLLIQPVGHAVDDVTGRIGHLNRRRSHRTLIVDVLPIHECESVVFWGPGDQIEQSGGRRRTVVHVGRQYGQYDSEIETIAGLIVVDDSN